MLLALLISNSVGNILVERYPFFSSPLLFFSSSTFSDYFPFLQTHFHFSSFILCFNFVEHFDYDYVKKKKKNVSIVVIQLLRVVHLNLWSKNENSCTPWITGLVGSSDLAVPRVLELFCHLCVQLIILDPGHDILKVY